MFTHVLLPYSLPAPIFYTTDDIPDLVIRTNIGAWPDYNVSTVRVLDGSDGSLLWTFNSTHSGMMSTVSIISDTHGRDALLFVALGVEGEGEEGEGVEGEGEKVEGQGGDSEKRRSKRKESRPMDNLVPDSAEASEGEFLVHGHGFKGMAKFWGLELVHISLYGERPIKDKLELII